MLKFCLEHSINHKKWFPLHTPKKKTENNVAPGNFKGAMDHTLKHNIYISDGEIKCDGLWLNFVLHNVDHDM